VSISRVSSATNNGTTITLGTHAKGDLILFFAGQFVSSGVLPALPSGVVELSFFNTGTRNIRFGFVVAGSSSESTGTTGWTSANNVTALVYRSSTGTLFPTRLSLNSNASGLTAGYTSQTAGTFKTNAADLWLVGYHGNSSASNSLDTLAPSGMTNILGSTGTGFGIALHDTNATRTTSWPTTNVTVANSVSYLTSVIEIAEFDPQISSAGGVRMVNIRGGADQ
jgi:hypothetical protein